MNKRKYLFLGIITNVAPVCLFNESKFVGGRGLFLRCANSNVHGRNTIRPYYSKHRTLDVINLKGSKQPNILHSVKMNPSKI